MDAYIDTSQTYNGDGTTPDAATSDGGVGAYNDIQSYLTAASTSGQTRGIVRRLNLGEEISITASLEPVNIGSINIPLSLIGYPYLKTLNSISINAINNLSRDNGNFFQFATNSSSVGDNSNYSHHWENAEITIHQSGSINDGLKRCCMWSDWDSTNNRMNFGLFPNLPEELTTSATFDISLKTPEYDNISVSAWDSDTNSAPIINTGTNSIFGFYPYSKNWWKICNFQFRGDAESYTFSRVPTCERIIINKPNGWGITAPASASFGFSKYKDVFIFSKDNSTTMLYNDTLYENFHVNTTEGRLFNYPNHGTFENVSFSKITDSDYLYYLSFTSNTRITLKNFETSIVYNKHYSTGLSYANPLLNYIRFINSNIDGTFRKIFTFMPGITIKSITSSDFAYWKESPSGSDFLLICVADKTSNTFPLFVNRNPAFVTANEEKTIDVIIQPSGWTTELTNAEIWIEVDYYNESTGINTVTATSKGTGITYTNDEWNKLSVTFTPGQSGIVEVRCFLAGYESGAYILIDPGSGV